MPKPLISICIPTNGVVDWVLPALERIYSQGGESERFEVIVADNGEESALQEAVERMSYSNLRYYRSQAKGFMNQIFCFNQANGDFIRMLNHRCMLAQGALMHLLQVVDQNAEEQPMIFFTNACLGVGSPIKCENFEKFLSTLMHFSSWSGGVSFWRQDLVRLGQINVDYLFPTTSILFEVRKESTYIVDDSYFQEPIDDSGKGGYNNIWAFAVHFLDMYTWLRYQNRISTALFLELKDRIWDFVVDSYYTIKVRKANYNFDMSNIPQNLSVYYGTNAYRRLLWQAYVVKPCKNLLKKLLRKN